MPGEVEFDVKMLEVQNIDGETAKKYMKRAGAFNTLLIDVRSEEEFAAGHIDGAINIPYNKLVEKSYLFPVQGLNETTYLIVYGSDDKDDRIQKACLTLQRIYPDFTKAAICNLGGMENFYK